MFFGRTSKAQEFPPHGQNYTYRFEHLDVDDGLSQSAVRGFFQDSRGYLWIGTLDGLNRYDGYNFKIYRTIAGDSSSISGNSISCIVEDTTQGFLWFATSGGLNRFDPVNEKFEHIRLTQSDSTSKESGSIRSMFLDKEGRLWLTIRNGNGWALAEYNSTGNKVSRYIIKYNDRFANHAGAITEDKFGNLWIGTDEGIFIFDRDKKQFITTLRNDPADINTIGNNNISCILKDPQGIMWVGHWGFPFGGLSKVEILNDNYSLTIKNFHQDFQKVLKDENTIPDNNLNELTQTKDGKIWIGTGWGLSILDPATELFTNIKVNPLNPSTIQENLIASVFVDRSGVVWLGYSSLGIGRLIRNKGFLSIQPSSNPKKSLTTGYVMGVREDSYGRLWVGTRGGGLNKIIFNGGYSDKYSVVQYNYGIGNKTIFLHVSSIVEKSPNRLWIATTGGGLFRMNSDTETFEYFPTPGSESNIDIKDVKVIYKDGQDDIWAGTIVGTYKVEDNNTDQPRITLVPVKDNSGNDYSYLRFQDYSTDNQNLLHAFALSGGIFYLDKSTQQFIKLHELSEQPIYSSHFSKQGHLWIGTQKGLHEYEQVKGDGSYSLRFLKTFNTKNSNLANDAIYEILEDLHGDLWMSHNKGISKYIIDKGQFKNYTYEDGLQSNEFSSNAGTNLRNGFLCFGGIKGLNIFHPDSLKDNSEKPLIAITDFKLLNKESSQHIDSRYELKYFENVMTFEFSALDFTSPLKNQYAYQMVGFDPDWIYSGSRRIATYTNLDPGTYTFRVKGSNNDGVWNEEGVSIKIIILPPPWRTWWAYSLYGLAFLIVLWVARNEIIKRERLRNEFRLKKLEAEKYHELDSMKSRFFANISHEFRTPLTLILGPIQKRMMLADSHDDKMELGMIERNAQRLLKLVNQLLDLSRLEAGTMGLKCSPGDLVAFARLIVQSFHSMAEAKGIRYTFDSSLDQLEIFFDPEKLEKIMNNLLSNAFKFTPSGGEIAVIIASGSKEDAKYPDGFVEIIVRDTGIGIPAEHLEKIFDRFYQVDSSQTREYEGTGIGLALTKELVDLHHGTINVKCTTDEGTVFSIRLPAGKSHLKPSEIQQATSQQLSPKINVATNGLDTRVSESMSQLHTVMIVEDNTDLRNYLRENLRQDYNILEAGDGEDGLMLGFEKIPDLIISDLMMPRMDGVQLSQQLKNDERTSHIPIILLTAKADSETKIKGLELGADDYISKPFDMKELMVRVRNLIEGRKKLREKYSSHIEHAKKRADLPVTKVSAVSMDERFLQKVMGIVEQNIPNADFGVDAFAREIGMSTTQLYRKLTALTGYSPNDFVRNIRLQRAADLLRQHAGNVSEIAYDTGFNNLSYFAKCFREKFGVTPSEFSERSSMKNEG